MKINTNIDLIAICSALVFLSGLIIWGVRLEERVAQLSVRLDAYERLTNAVGKIRLESINYQLHELSTDVMILKRRFEDGEGSDEEPEK